MLTTHIAACKFILPIHDCFFPFHTTAFQKYLWGSAVPRPKFFPRQYLGHLFYFTFRVHSLLYAFMNLENCSLYATCCLLIWNTRLCYSHTTRFSVKYWYYYQVKCLCLPHTGYRTVFLVSWVKSNRMPNYFHHFFKSMIWLYKLFEHFVVHVIIFQSDKIMLAFFYCCFAGVHFLPWWGHKET